MHMPEGESYLGLGHMLFYKHLDFRLSLGLLMKFSKTRLKVALREHFVTDF